MRRAPRTQGWAGRTGRGNGEDCDDPAFRPPAGAVGESPRAGPPGLLPRPVIVKHLLVPAGSFRPRRLPSLIVPVPSDRGTGGTIAVVRRRVDAELPSVVAAFRPGPRPPLGREGAQVGPGPAAGGPLGA